MNNWIKLTSGVLIYLNKILLNNYVNKKYNQYKYFDFKQDQLQLLFFNKNNKNKKFDNFKKSSQYKRMFEDVSSNSTSHFFKLITFISFLLLYRFYCHIIETTSTYNFFSILKEFCIIFIGIFLILMSWYLILYLKYAILYPSKHFIKIKKLNEKKFKRYCYKNYKFTHYTIYFF